MQMAKDGLKENHQEFLSMLKDVDNKVKTDLDLAQSNSILQTENAEKIKSVEFDVSSLKNETEELRKKNQDLNVMKSMTPRTQQWGRHWYLRTFKYKEKKVGQKANL